MYVQTTKAISISNPNIGSIELSWIGEQKHITKYTFKGRGESGLMFDAAFDRPNWPDVRPVFGKPSLKENYSDLPKTGIKAMVDIYGEFKWNSC